MVGEHKKWFLIAGAVLLLAGVAGFVAATKLLNQGQQSVSSHDKQIGVKEKDSAAVKAGKQLSGGQCDGSGVNAKLSVSPMKPEDFTMLIPYGGVIYDHVTPIDHQYFSPRDYNSPVNAYEVRAMADGHITSIGSRTNASQGGTEYRLNFTQTCTFQYYYDLVTGLATDLKAAYDESSRDSAYTQNPFSFKVKAGQVIGYIGGRTLDFAVWDTEKPLKGFVVPEHYKAESWKLYTADPLDYYTPELKELMLSKSVRTAEPISGKIDYDVDGKLIGNWFLEGTDYGGPTGSPTGPGSHKGHLAFVPDYFDPTQLVISIGNYPGNILQFAARGNAPWPAEISTESGLVKYELVQINYLKADGSFWNRTTFTKGVQMQGTQYVQGTVLVQLTENRKLRFEAFPGRSTSQVSGFSANAKVYTR